jgi:hypothetical protein
VSARPPLLVWVIPIGIVAAAVYGFWEGTPLDTVDLVRRGTVEEVRAALDRDPSRVHTKVYPQAYERVSDQQRYYARTGRSAWAGRTLVHEAAARVEGAVPMLETLAAAGADLSVRLEGRSLLHLAAAEGQLDVVAWLLDRGVDIDVKNDCANNCVELGQTPLFDAQRFKDQDMNQLLLERGADPHARSANGQTALHASAAVGSPAGAFELCRYGTDPTLKDARGQTAHDIALATDAAGRGTSTTLLYGPGELADWLKPGGGCEQLASRVRATGAPVSDEDARVVFGAYVCARGIDIGCTAAK